MNLKTASLPLLFGLALVGCGSPDAGVQPASTDLSASLFTGADGEALAQEITFEHLSAMPNLLGGIGEYRVSRVKIDDRGMAHTRLQQTIDGVPVWGGEGIVHLNGNGTLFGATDNMIRGLQVNTTPAYSASEATDIALFSHGARKDLSQAPTADLWVLRTKEGVSLAWRVQIRDIEDNEAPSMPVVFVDAHSGETIWSYDNLQTYSLSDSDKVTYDIKHRTSTKRASVGTDSDSDLLTTHNAVGSTLAFFSSAVGRDSYNGSGAVVKTYGHYSNNYVNAFWDGVELMIGDGDGYYSNYLGVLDVTAHEFSHGVTEYEANLNYSYESGALNEAASDMAGASVEAYVDGAVTQDTWDIGEDCWIEPGTTALRYMSSPSSDGSSRDHYSNRYTGSSDNGGVHWNSGIGNYWFYLLSEGGQHHTTAYQSGYTVTGLGIDAAYQIWYEALANYMTSSTDFAGARTATESACSALGYSSTDCESVSYAWYEVGVGSDPSGATPVDTATDTGTGGTPTSSCTSGQTSYTGALIGSGDSAIEPGGTYAYYTGGTSGYLYGDTGTDFDLYLYRYSGGRWRVASSSTSTGSTESVSYGSSAYYYYYVYSYSGAGSYELCVQ